jgi:transaldolase
MKIFLDTASLAEIREAATLGVVDGITTNPSLLAKEKGDPEEILVEICKTIDGPISGEVVATDADGMVREGRHLASLHKNIVVKCPCTMEWLKATSVLTGEGKRDNTTLIVSAPQPRPAPACVALRAGSTTSRRPGGPSPTSSDLRPLRLRLRGAGGEPRADARPRAARMGADIGTMPMSVSSRS